MAGDGRILVVDDDEALRDALTIYLRTEGYEVDAVSNGHDLMERLKTKPGIILLDVNLPGQSGFELARQIRTKSDVGIIMLTGRTDLVDTVVGLELGADDYIAKPFRMREVLARIRAVLRRREKGAATREERPGDPLVRFAGFILDPARRTLFAPDGLQLSLTTKEFAILHLLALNQGRAVSREEIFEKAIGGVWSSEGRSVDMHVGHLRKKLESDTKNPQLIKTVHGTGYTLAVGGVPD